MTVTVLSKDGCNPCRMTKIAFEKYGISYEDVNIADNDEAFQVVKDLGYQQVPVVLVGDDSWSGYRIDRIKELAATLAVA